VAVFVLDVCLISEPVPLDLDPEAFDLNVRVVVVVVGGFDVFKSLDSTELLLISFAGEAYSVVISGI
jgi:hypothetical protein